MKRPAAPTPWAPPRLTARTLTGAAGLVCLTLTVMVLETVRLLSPGASVMLYW